MESLLHYVWKHKLFHPSTIFTTDNIPVTIIDPGIHNTNEGPDFFNAKIKIEDKTWVGNIEIHLNASDWEKHGHHLNKSYNSVILHVVETMDKEKICRENGELIPQIILKIPDHIRNNYNYLLTKDQSIPCLEQIYQVKSIYLFDWINSLTTERLKQKCDNIFRLLYQYNDWSEVFYIILSRNFGFGINNDIFERLSKSLPLKYIYKHKDSFIQVEALFFGQAGLLKEHFEDEYFSLLQNEYHFLQKKYKLISLDAHLFKNLRIRPNNFPHIKIAQLSSLIRNNDFLFSKVIEIDNIKEMKKMFICPISSYWTDHYQFGKKSPQRKKILGATALDIILINTVVPILFSYGMKKNNSSFIQRAYNFLDELKPERNMITTLFRNAGVHPINAADSQGLIQLKNEYCDKRKCIFCRIGYKLLSKPSLFD